MPVCPRPAPPVGSPDRGTCLLLRFPNRYDIRDRRYCRLKVLPAVAEEGPELDAVAAFGNIIGDEELQLSGPVAGELACRDLNPVCPVLRDAAVSVGRTP